MTVFEVGNLIQICETAIGFIQCKAILPTAIEKLTSNIDKRQRMSQPEKKQGHLPARDSNPRISPIPAGCLDH